MINPINNDSLTHPICESQAKNISKYLRQKEKVMAEWTLKDLVNKSRFQGVFAHYF